MSKRHGFTLIEVLIVLVVIGVLAGLGLPRYRGPQAVAHYAAMRADLRNLHLKQQLYFEAPVAGTNRARAQYADSADEPALAFTASSGVNVQVTVAPGGSGWSAIATHSAFGNSSDRACAIFIGEAEPIPPATQPGSIACHES